MNSSPFQLYNQFKITIIEDDIESCSDNFAELLKKGNFQLQPVKEVNFAEVCSSKDLDYNPSIRRFLLYAPSAHPTSTVFFTNLVDGWYTAVYNYTRLFHRSAFLTGFSPMSGNTQPAFFFHHFQNDGNEMKERVIHLIKEDKWIFVEKGDPLDFEELSIYQRRIKTERLNNDIILSYLKKAGYDLTREDFYRSDATIFLGLYS